MTQVQGSSFNQAASVDNAPLEAAGKVSPQVASGAAASQETNLSYPQQSALFVSAFFDELIRMGVQDVVVSPGSRSTPLSMIAYESSLNLYLDVDERGAAFFALGLAKATDRAVALICTSGTAVANYYPAVMEAEISRVPLLVLTGDRPAHLQQLGAPQTVDQLKVFSNHVRGFWNMPEPSADAKKIAFARQIAREVCIAAAAGTLHAAPVHINFPFDEPLKPDTNVEGLFEVGRSAGHDLPALVRPTSGLNKQDAQRFADFISTHKTIAFCGEGTLSVADVSARNAEHDLLCAFAKRFDVPLFADPLSQLRSFDDECIIDNYDNIFRRDTRPEYEAVIRFGRYPLSKGSYVDTQKTDHIQIVVDPLDTRDFNAKTTTFVEMNPLEFVVSLLDVAGGADASVADRAEVNAAETNGVSAVEKGSSELGAYCAEWALLDNEEKLRIEAVAETGDDTFEGSYVSALMKQLPDDALLFSANSMAVRAVDTFYTKESKRLTVLANRGLNGIDGTLSSAIGAAHAFSPSVFLTGDLTLLHDINALHLQYEMLLRNAEGAALPSLVVVLLNNSGGAIFDILPQKSDDAYFKRLFLTPQRINFAGAAEAFSVPYAAVSSVEAFTGHLNEWLGKPGIHLIDIALPLEGVRDRYRPYQG